MGGAAMSAPVPREGNREMEPGLNACIATTLKWTFGRNQGKIRARSREPENIEAFLKKGKWS
jgi:hypothetical protein